MRSNCSAKDSWRQGPGTRLQRGQCRLFDGADEAQRHMPVGTRETTTLQPIEQWGCELGRAVRRIDRPATAQRICAGGAGARGVGPSQTFSSAAAKPHAHSRGHHGHPDGCASTPGARSAADNTIRSAVATAARRTVSRSPAKCCSSVCAAAPRCASANHTRPTGFSAVPPSGPAIPVTATARSAPLSCRAPPAICSAVDALTAPWACSVRRARPATAPSPIRIGHVTALEPLGATGYVRHALRDPAAGAGFGHDQPPMRALQRSACLHRKCGQRSVGRRQRYPVCNADSSGAVTPSPISQGDDDEPRARSARSSHRLILPRSAP